MIVKNLTWKKHLPKKLLEYVYDKNKSQNDQRPIYWNISDPTFEGTLNAFKENHKFKPNRKNGNELLHDILSFSPEDSKNLTHEILEDLVIKYLELRANKNIAFANIHNDKGHLHAHIAITPNEFRSKKVKHLSNKEYREIRILLEQYQLERYPFLDKSIVFIDNKVKQKQQSEKEFQMQKRSGISQKEYLKSFLGQCISTSNTKEHFFNRIMQEENIEVYIYRGKPNGVIFEGKKFRFSTLGLKNDILGLEKSENKEISERLEQLRKLQNKQQKDRFLEL